MTGERPLELVLLELILLVLLGPLVTGIIQKLKARLQCRQGAGVLQPYHDHPLTPMRKSISQNATRWREVEQM